MKYFQVKGDCNQARAWPPRTRATALTADEARITHVIRLWVKIIRFRCVTGMKPITKEEIEN